MSDYEQWRDELLDAEAKLSDLADQLVRQLGEILQDHRAVRAALRELQPRFVEDEAGTP